MWVAVNVSRHKLISRRVGVMEGREVGVFGCYRLCVFPPYKSACCTEATEKLRRSASSTCPLICYSFIVYPLIPFQPLYSHGY